MGVFSRLFGSKPDTTRYTIPVGDEVFAPTRKQGHHYLFAHRALPSVAHASPAEMLMWLANDHVGFLGRIWATAGEQAAKNGQAIDRSFRPKVTERRRVNNTTWHVIPMPQPRISPEAYFIALGIHTDGATSSARVLALELSDKCVLLGEWTREGVHLNYGPVDVALEAERFLDLCLSDAATPGNLIAYIHP